MSNLVKYRMAEEKDLEQIRSIFNYYIRNTNDIYDKTERSSDYMKNWWEQKKQMNFPIILAELKDHIIGFASYGPFRRWEGYSCTVEHSVYVREDQHSKGVGKELMRSLIDIARKNKLHSIIGGVDASNISSLKFHAKLGFVERGRIPDVAFKNNKYLELVLVQKILNQ